MSHGGFGGGHGGGGHHGGFGHHGGDSLFGHQQHHHIGHGLGFLGGHGSILGHLLHALGLGHNLHHHGAGTHPDQSALWSQAWQSGKKWRLGRFSLRPFLLVFFILFGSFLWLYLIYRLHKTDTTAHAVSAEPPAANPYGYGNGDYAQQQASAVQNYAQQYINDAATTSGANNRLMSATYTPQPYGGIYGAAPAYGDRQAAYAGAAESFGQPRQYVAGMPGAVPPQAMAGMQAVQSLGTVQPYANPRIAGSMQPRYAPIGNGRCRLIVAR